MATKSSMFYIRSAFTLNDNRTTDLVAILCTLVVLIGCLVFLIRAFNFEEKPDYLNFFGGIAAIVTGFGRSKNKTLGTPDITEVSGEIPSEGNKK